MNSSTTKIIGINQNLSEICDNKGIFYIDLSQTVNASWQNVFHEYITTYKPAVFSLHRPIIIEDKLLRVHAELDGPWGIENVFLHLQCIVKYANSKCKKTMLMDDKASSWQSSSDIKKLQNRLASLNY